MCVYIYIYIYIHTYIYIYIYEFCATIFPTVVFSPTLEECFLVADAGIAVYVCIYIHIYVYIYIYKSRPIHHCLELCSRISFYLSPSGSVFSEPFSRGTLRCNYVNSFKTTLTLDPETTSMNITLSRNSKTYM